MKDEICLNWRRLQPLGFQSKNMFEPNQRTRGSFIKVVGTSIVYINSGYTPQRIGIFPTTAEELAAYRAGKLTLVPPGCCAPGSHGTTIYHQFQTIHQGPVQDAQHLAEILSVTYRQIKAPRTSDVVSTS